MGIPDHPTFRSSRARVVRSTCRLFLLFLNFRGFLWSSHLTTEAVQVGGAPAFVKGSLGADGLLRSFPHDIVSEGCPLMSGYVLGDPVGSERPYYYRCSCNYYANGYSRPHINFQHVSEFFQDERMTAEDLTALMSSPTWPKELRMPRAWYNPHSP
jgi:hypothetical protein